MIGTASVVAHAGFVAAVHWDGGDFEPPPPEEKVAASLVSYSCELDAAVASLAQVTICTTPFGGNRDECFREANTAHLLAYLECKREPEEVFVSMIDVDKIKPMKLLDIAPVDDVVAAELLEKEVLKKVEEAQKQIQQTPRQMNAQVVEITQPDVQIRPDNARFVSKFDSQTTKETVARGSTEEMVAKPSPKDVAIALEATELPKELTSPEDLAEGSETVERPSERTAESNGLLAMRGPGDSERDPQKARELGRTDGSTAKISSDGITASQGDGASRVERTELSPKGGDGEAGEQKKGGIPNLRPSVETLTRTVGGGSVDKLDGAESAEFTALNSKKWKYASFFNRMKRRVSQHWHPDKVYARRDPTGKVYGVKDRVTLLRVSLKPNGSVANIIVARRSDIRFLDDEAIRAFKEAGPFPNPPGALVEADGLITFSFGFHFHIGGRSGAFKIFRSR